MIRCYDKWLLLSLKKRNELSMAVHSIDRILQKFEYLTSVWSEFSKYTKWYLLTIFAEIKIGWAIDCEHSIMKNWSFMIIWASYNEKVIILGFCADYLVSFDNFGRGLVPIFASEAKSAWFFVLCKINLHFYFLPIIS